MTRNVSMFTILVMLQEGNIFVKLIVDEINNLTGNEKNYSFFAFSKKREKILHFS